jgi:DNA-directed RNA polymerase specialized sigma24 family protein
MFWFDTDRMAAESEDGLMSDSGSNRPTGARFPTTHWSRIFAASDPVASSSRAALEALCLDYWFPLYAFVRRRGLSPHDAEDIVQGFLADLLSRGDLSHLDPSNGTFRSFLRAACEHYLANQRNHDRAAKRGGEVKIVCIDRLEAENRLGREPATELTPQRVYERQWALTLLESVQAGKAELFARLRPVLQGDGLAPPYPTIATELGMTDGAVRVAAHRLRVRYRELLREEVGRTTDDPLSVDAEIAELLAALAGR